MLRKIISVVIPAFNEEDCVEELSRRLTQVSDKLSSTYDFEFVIVENGSVDGTFEKLLAIHGRDPRFKILRLSRNFGIEGALTAGLRFIVGDAAIIMCADLQDPPELLPTLIQKWEEGYEHVYCVVARRPDESLSRRTLTRGFYWLINRFNEQPIPENASDFRLVDRKLYEALNQLNERNRMLRAVWGWFGFRSIGIPYERAPRYGGTSTYGLFRNISFALRGIASSSATPLKTIPMAGIALAACSFLLLVAFVVRWVAFGVPFSGFGTIVALMLLLFGLLFLFLGVLSEYVGIIYEEVRARPIYVTREAYGLGDRVEEEPTVQRVMSDRAM